MARIVCQMKPLGQGKRGKGKEGKREENRWRKTERDTETHRQRDRERIASFSLRKRRFLDFHFYGSVGFLKRLHMGV